MSVGTMSEADSKFIADNMLTADDFDIHGVLDLSFDEDILYRMANNDAQLPFKFPEMDLCSAKAMGAFSSVDATLEHFLASQKAEEIVCDVEVRTPPPNLSPGGSTSGCSSRSSWNDECSVAEISVSDTEMIELKTELPDTPPHTPPGSTISPASPPPLYYNTKVLSPCPTNNNNKVPIQPNNNSPQHPILPSGNGTTSRPLILTAEQFAKLMGVESCAVTSVRQGSNNGYVRPLTSNRNVDPKALKRQQRMIKNRESACLSRKKKKEHLQKLEMEVGDLLNLNNHLLTENAQLRQRITTLENDIEILRKTVKTKDVKKATCLMGLLFLVALNIAPFSGLLSSSGGAVKPVELTSKRVGRSLLWNGEGVVGPPPPSVFEDVLLSEGRNLSVCHINKTESLRLENELRGWAMRVEKQKTKPIRKKLPVPRLPTWFKHASTIPNKAWSGGAGSGQNGIQIYGAHRSLFKDLFDAIPRRDDTFYFVSFSGDHFLLPASAHNKTQRPKMSLVMPAMTLNETEGAANRVTMMQIDCEVMNTKLVYIKESVIPAHLRHNRTLLNRFDFGRHRNDSDP